MSETKIQTEEHLMCPLCRHASAVVFQIDGFDIRDCQSCAHRFLPMDKGEEHVASTYSDDYFFAGGAGYSDYTKEAEMLRKRGRQYAAILGKLGVEPGVMLDVGAAAGFLIAGFADAGWDCTGLEPNAGMVEYGGTELGLKMLQGSLETFESKAKFDLVSIIQVAAHFYDPVAAFQKSFDLLEENGVLLIETWDRSSYMARLFGKGWHEYSPPSVLQWFSKAGLANCLVDIGFEHIKTGTPSKKISGGHARSLLEHKVGKRAFLKLIPKSLDIPYPSEDLFYSVFRKP